MHQDLLQSDTPFDKERFDEDMVHILGDVSDDQKPTHPVTNVHLAMLQSIKNCVKSSSKRCIFSWISMLEMHLNEPSASTSSVSGMYLLLIYHFYQMNMYFRMIIIRTQDNYQVMRAQGIPLVARTNSLGTASHIQEGAIFLIDLLY
jgi:hypothetical protein